MFEEGAELKEKHGAGNVADLSLGNPVTEPPAEFHRELKRLVENPPAGMHRYMANAGYADTRAAVAAQLSRETGISFTQDEVVMTCGAAGALNVVLKTVLDPGDEVIIFAPYFPEYLSYVENHGGVARVLAAGERFIPSLDTIAGALGEKTRAVVINSPNNPTGVVYREDFIRELGRLLHDGSARLGRQIFLISDEAYRRIIYDGLKYPYIWPHYQQSLVVTSHSKDLALAGERIGYIAVHPDCYQREELVAGLIHCNRVLGYVNAPALMQHLVRQLQAVTVDIADYQQKRDFMYQNLVGMGYSLVKPGGAFYLFPRSPLEDDVAFVRGLQQHLVLTVPGRGFGTPGYFRIAYCVDDKTLECSLDGFRRAAREFKLS
jgi:aspartate aminotransferase